MCVEVDNESPDCIVPAADWDNDEWQPYKNQI